MTHVQFARFIQVSHELAHELEARDQTKADLRAQGTALVSAGSMAEAEATYRNLVALDPKDADAWCSLGLLYLKVDRPHDAVEALLRSLQLNWGQAQAHVAFGAAASAISPAPPALAAYLQLLGLAEIDPALLDSPAKDLLASAEAHCRAECARAPDQPDLQARLGYVLLARGQVAQAVEALEAAFRLRPDDDALVDALAGALHLTGEHGRASLVLARAHYRARRYGEAIEAYRQGLAAHAGAGQDYVDLTHALNYLRRFGEAIETCAAGSRQHPSTPDLYYEWVYALLEINRTQEAVALAAQAAKRFPDSPALAYQRDLALPVLYQSTEEITKWRQRFADGLERLSRETNLDSAGATRAALKALDPPFYLTYQGLDDTRLQQQYGQLVHRIVAANYPAYAATPAMPALAPGERIRVGYVSASLRWQGVGEMFLGWLAHRDSERFEVYVYNVGKSEDLVARQFELTSDRYHWLPRDLEAVCRQVRADQVHILVFFDVGMDPFMTQAAALRLAPVQCAALGHSVTTGLPTVDYFVSAEFAEPANGQNHYTERLVLLPNIGLCPRRPFTVERLQGRDRLGLDEDAIIYLSWQSISKYLPQHDDLIPAIAQRVPAARFLFRAGSVQEHTDLLRARLLRAFATCGLDGERYIRFIPPLDYTDYLGLYLISDIFLDPVGWSGGFTALDALGYALPVVTLPGEFMRGRQAFAFLQQVGVLDTVASDTTEYVEIAARLGLDPGWRTRIRQQIAERSERLYDEEERVRGLERFFWQAVVERLERGNP